jgi:hypothetical protein
MEFDNSSQFNITRHWNLFTEIFHCNFMDVWRTLFGSSLAQGLQQCWPGGKEEGGLYCCTGLSFPRSASFALSLLLYKIPVADCPLDLRPHLHLFLFKFQFIC